MDLGIAGRRAAVAAASKGLGFGVAQALAREGVRVAICGRHKDTVEDAAARIGPDVVPIVADVSHIDGATGFVRDAHAALGGPLDILVPNAGGPPPGDFEHTKVDQYLDAFELNCRGAIAMCYEAIPAMRQQRWGRVVAITSIAVRQPIATLILSNTARAGLTGFLKTVAREIASDGVTVNSLLPGLHATDRVKALHGEGFDPSQLGDPADFGAVAAFLCSEHARFVTGAALQVDGGAYEALL
jgi:3-oxoacyl-[acyl-carrier protein] reductase